MPESLTPRRDSAANADADALTPLFAQLVVAAGALAMEVFERTRIDARIKTDDSPVSEADERVEAFLMHELDRALPGVPVIAEESAARGELATHGDAFLLVDPIDATREFVAHGQEFTINLALVRGARPRAAAIYAPALGQLWLAGARACRTDAAPGGVVPAPEDWRPLRTRRRPADGLIALISKSHLDSRTVDFLARAPIKETRPTPSSIKFCRLAAGEADVYPRYGRTMEWDTAAGDAILTAAGGAVLDPQGAPLRYGKAEDLYRNGPFIAWADPLAATFS